MFSLALLLLFLIILQHCNIFRALHFVLCDTSYSSQDKSAAIFEKKIISYQLKIKLKVFYMKSECNDNIEADI